MGLRKKSRDEATSAHAETTVNLSPEELADDEAVLDSDVREDLLLLASQKLRSRLGIKKELANLPTLLAEDEHVLNLAAGQYDDRQGLLAVTDTRLIFHEKGMVRSRQEDFPYSKISSIQTSTGMVFGELSIFVSGNKAKIHHVVPKERTNEIGDYIRARISDTAPAPAASTVPPERNQADPATRLKALQSMHSEGLISAEEYESKRLQILADL